ncbi:MAG: hypothetical protein GY940_27410 [bacterium]|nr:hypothetical protein [bacterium]
MKKVTVLVVVIMLVAMLVFPLSGAQKKQRNYMLVFEALSFSNQIKDAVNHFFKEVFQKGDLLILVTPAKIKGFPPDKLNVPTKQLAAEIIKILKADIASGSAKQRDLLKEMESLTLTVVRDGAQPGGVNMRNYMQLRKDLIIAKGSYEAKLTKYAKIFRRARGDNHLIMFMEREYRPIPNRDAMETLRSDPRNTGFLAAEAFQEEKFKSGFNLEQLTAEYKYTNVRFHFLYFQGKKHRTRREIQWIDNLGDAYSDFTKLSKATNGLKMTTSKPSAFVKMIRRLVVEGKVEVEVVDEKMDK